MLDKVDQVTTGRLREGLIAGGLLSLAIVSQAWATGSNPDHQISVFSIEAYGAVPDSQHGTSPAWKDAITVGNSSMDAYNTFYTTMTGCGSDACAHAASFRKKDAAVTVNAMTTAGGSGSMDNTDLLFFYGHNISMQEWNLDHVGFHVWVPWNTTTLQTQSAVTGSWAGGDIECVNCAKRLDAWGTTSVPYYYHRTNTNIGNTGINDASINKSYGVFYAYNALTSVLMGKDFTTGTWITENTQDVPGSPPPGTSHTGQLGSSDVDFMVANGCEGVPVAQYVNHTPAPGAVVLSAHARNQWKPSWRGLHMAVGHYVTISVSCLPNVTTFANDLMAGDGVMRSYFESHTLCFNTNEPGKAEPGGLAPRNNIYDADRWTSPEMADPTTTDEAGGWFGWFWAAQ